jgi:nucleoside-diphosphate-sugar epimerase
MRAKRVLVTGMSGLIGGAVRRALADRYELSALNRRPVAGLRSHLADIADLDAIRPAFTDVDVVVHLAAASRGTLPWSEIRDANLVGVYNVYEAARAAGVTRVVYASSGATIAGYEREAPYSELAAGRGDRLVSWPPITHETPVRPNTLYGASKVWGEALGRYYADAMGLSVICLRFGAVNEQDRPLATRDFAVWCSQRDAVQAVERAIDAPADVRYAVVHVVSDNRWGYRDLAHARRVLGFVPLDRAEDHR